MNTNLLNIVKQIIAANGEGILGDPERLKSLFSDLAKDEPKPLRVAFGRCIQNGAYIALKTAPNAADRIARKTALAQNLRNQHGIDPLLCGEALDILEAALFGTASSTQRPAQQQQQAQQPQYQQPAQWNTPPASGTSASGAFNALLKGKISRKSLIVGAAAGAGAFFGHLIAFALNLNKQTTSSVLNMALVFGVVSLGISIALIAVHHILLRKPHDFSSLLKPALLGILSGAVSGGIAQAIFSVTQQISPFIEALSNALCWGFFGAGLGFGVSLFIHNYPKKRAMRAGFFGGTLGGTIYVALLSSGTNAGGYIGITTLGFAIGLAILFIEEALRDAWLTVMWGPKESVTISLGAKPIVFGSSRDADVFLPSRSGSAPVPPIRATVALENGQVVLDDRTSGRRTVLQNGGEFTLDRLRVIVNTKS